MANNTNATATVNNATMEEATMKKCTANVIDAETNEQVEIALDLLSLEELMGMKNFTKDAVRDYLKEMGVEYSNTAFKKIKRAELIRELHAAMHPGNKCAGCEHEFDIDGEPYCRCEDTDKECVKEFMGVSVGDLDITHDNVPEEEEHVYVPYGDDTSMLLLEKIIRFVNSNKDRNFVTDWMLSSIISEALVTKLPLKEYKDGKLVEHYLTFSKAQKDNINDIKAEFLKRSQFIPVKDKNDGIVGYYIPAKSLVYGRNKWLGVACVYRFKKNMNLVYHVSYNEKKNATTGEVVKLTPESRAELYAQLDADYVFMY